MGKHISELTVPAVDNALEKIRKDGELCNIPEFKPVAQQSKSYLFVDGGVLKFYSASDQTEYTVGLS